MKPIRSEVSWKFLDDFRGKAFNAEWPTMPQMFHITQMRFPDRPCFVDFEGTGQRILCHTHRLGKIFHNLQTGWQLTV